MAELSTRTSPLDVNQDIADRDTQPAVQALAGVRQFISPHVAVFLEYRFLHSEPFDFGFRVPGTLGGAPVTETARDHAGLTTHQITGGIGFHW
jgi:opacity protein-like surface antigen